MYICVYVYMYVCIYIYIYVYTYMLGYTSNDSSVSYEKQAKGLIF